MTLLCIGEVMAEISGQAPDFAIGFAGDTFNTAIYAQRALGAGKVRYLTRLGADPLSDACRDFAAREGVVMARNQRDPDANIGIYAIATDAAGERSFSYWRSASAARKLFAGPGDADALKHAEMIYFSGITLAILSPDARNTLLTAAKEAQERGARIAFDSNYRPRLWEDKNTARRVCETAFRLCDIALPSLDDEMALFGDPDQAAVQQRLAGWDCMNGALKRGPQGPVLLSGAPMEPLRTLQNPVDTTAAGDSFNGGFLAAILEGRSHDEAAGKGHALAGQVVMKHGAIVPTF